MEPLFDHVGCAPFAAQQRIEAKVPPEIVVKKLRSTLHFPLAEHIKRLAIEHENTARPFSVGRSQRADIDAFGSAMDRVRARVVRPAVQFLRFNDFDDIRLSRVWFGIDDVQPRRPQTRHD